MTAKYESRVTIGTGGLSSRNAQYGIEATRDRNIEHGTQRLLEALWKHHSRILFRLGAEPCKTN